MLVMMLATPADRRAGPSSAGHEARMITSEAFARVTRQMSQLRYRLRFGRDHRWAGRRMSAYLDGELAVLPRTRMERHARECPECRRLLAGLRQTMAALHRLAAPGGGADPVQIAASVRLRLGQPPPP
jgi:anti-sigma factor RsiW